MRRMGGAMMSEKETTLTSTESVMKQLYVGIGASAGGLEALRSLVAALPTESNMCYIIAQHMDPKHPSLLRELIARASNLSVQDVTDELQPQVNTIYITPPGHNVVMRQKTLYLEPVAHIGPKPSVDLFFTSLAESVGEDAIGIILSGTGSDGAHGVRAIKAAGGITISQDEQSAKYNGMPRSAIDTGLVDLVREPAQIAQELTMLSSNPAFRHRMQNLPVAKSDMDRIFQLVLEQTDCDFSNYKPNTLQRRIQRRMAVHKLEHLPDYVALLERSPSEVELLFKDILISVTEFFRDADADAYALLEQYITDMVKRNLDHEPLRIWVPGCATGEEAYSIAMVADKVLSKLGNRYGFQVFATDIDMDALSHARRGIYLPNTIRHVSSEMLERYFVVRDDTYTVSKRIRERVVFARQDLVRDPPFSKIDLVSCRNVLIYFNPILQKRVLNMFHYVLKPNGLLFLGKSESVSLVASQFVNVDKKVRLFRKQFESDVTAYPMDFVSAAGRRVEKPATSLRMQKEDISKSIDERLNQVLLDRLTIPTIIVDDKNDIVHIRGDVSTFISFPSGRMEPNLLKMVRDELRIDARALLHKARREGLTKGPRILIRNGEQPSLVQITVVPMPTLEENSARLWAVLFASEVYDAHQPQPDIETDNELQTLRVSELEQELMAMREHLQTTIEELETSNEELQSTNEELQSANEELQSTNEELETANEELQSTNEELSTVNQELQIKTAELASVNADLENVLASMSIPLLVVDNRLRITRFSSAAKHVFDIKQSDLGQIITSLNTNFVMTDLRNQIHQVMQDGIMLKTKVHAGAQAFQLTITPYYSEKRQVQGALILFESVDDGSS